MGLRFLKSTCAFFILCLFRVTYSQDVDFPYINELEIEFYQTEVQVVDVEQQVSAYATEYYDNLDDRGKLEMLTMGEKVQIYFNNRTYEVFSVNSTTCEVWDADLSEYTNSDIYYGWTSMDPLVIGPSAPLYLANRNRDKITSNGTQNIRGMECDVYKLEITGKRDNVTFYYYFAKKGWVTPYEVKSNGQTLRVPMRIHVTGISSKDSEAADEWVVIDQINDFAYFKPVVDDMLVFQPPIGIGCSLRAKTDDFPGIPEVFQLSAESVDFFQADSQATTNIESHKLWYDYTNKMARFDLYSKQRMISELHDFKTGVIYSILDDRSCNVKPLRDSYFEAYDLGLVARMKGPKRVLYLHGEFYEMGMRKIRGMKCDTYESVLTNVSFKNKILSRLVVTAYFLERDTKAGIDGEMESRMPIYIMLTGWDTPTTVAVKAQYNIFEFKPFIFPEMYQSFRLQRCYPDPDAKTYFNLVFDVPAKVAAAMEDQGAMIIAELRSEIAKYAKVSDIRIPFLKADYRPSGVYVTGLMLERPPAFIQFYSMDSGATTTKDPDLKVSTAANLEECAYACIDEGDFPCKGFYMCNDACFLKSVDPAKSPGEGSERNLGDCDDYIRTEGESSNFRDTYLNSALDNLKAAVMNESLKAVIQVADGTEVIAVREISIGVGPDADMETGDAPFKQAIKYRRLNPDDKTTITASSTETLQECYQSCKESGSLCSSFSYCSLSPKREKECLLSSRLIVDEKTNIEDTTSNRDCFVYHLKYLDYYEQYDGKVALISGFDVFDKVESAEVCAQNCRLTKGGKCRGFEYCPKSKTCTLHSKHILELNQGEVVDTRSACTHYAAKFIADYDYMGLVILKDNSDVRQSMSLEECAKTCSEELKDGCKSFNYCPNTMPIDSDSTCSLSSQLIRDTSTKTSETDRCRQYEKKSGITDWKAKKAAAGSVSASGYTSKGFTGLVIGMLALGLIVGAACFVGYSYYKSRSSGEGMTVRFMKQES